MNVYIKNLTINENGKTTTSLTFSEGLTVVENRTVIKDAIHSILGKGAEERYDRDYTFFAEVYIDETYFLRSIKPKGEPIWAFLVQRECDGEECTSEYFDLLTSSAEMDELTFFHRSRSQNYPDRLMRYNDILTHYPEGDFARITNGYGKTRSFRGFVADYIKHFKPICLNENKNLYLNLLPNGKFVITDSQICEVVSLSESEKQMYHYYSFLSLADFWSRAEKIRNFNCVNKPLMIAGLVERLDESVDLSEVLRRTDKLDRQTILFVPREVHLPNYRN